MNEILEYLQTNLTPLNPGTGEEQHPAGSIMEYGVVCQHDDGYMCECRAKHLVTAVSKMMEYQKSNP